jgi:hypothetical protein
MTLVELVKNKKVHFKFYVEGNLWYENDDGFKFPVPIDDTGNGFFNAEDDAIVFMRWIRKHLAFIESAKKEQFEGSKTTEPKSS